MTAVSSPARSAPALTPAPNERLAGGPSQVALALLRALEREDVRYCHWKSNEHLAEGLRGETDLDILIAREDRARAEAVLAQCGFRRFQPTALMAYDAIEDYIAFDPDTARLLHCHTHYRLVAGEQHLKGYRLPWEHVVLARRVRDVETGIFVTDPVSEMLVLLVRLALKVRWRDGVLAALGRPYVRGGYLREYRWLRARLETESCLALCRELLGPPAVDACRKLLEGHLGLASVLRFRLRARKSFALFRTHGRLASRLKRWVREVAWAVAVMTRRRMRLPTPLRRTNPSGGLIVAFIGPDGSGKSTVTNAVAMTFVPKLDVLLLYFGSGDGPSSLIRWPFRVARTLLERLGMLGRGSERSHGAAEPRRERRPALLSVARAVWALVLAREKRMRLRTAWRARNRGMLVITDRYPQAQITGFNDGPLLTHWSAHRSRLLRRLAQWERVPYEWAERYPADLVIKLVVSPETALRRKPDTGAAEVERKVKALRTLRYDAPAVVAEINADEHVDRVIRNASLTIWKHLQ